MDVPAKYHSKIIGNKGEVVNRLRSEYNVQIRIPARAEEGKEADTAFKVIGYEQDCEKARVAILEIVSHLVSVHSST